ncbi:three component ABC system middle component [Bacillus sp. AFS029533]|uniref:three component ABC system middle component n=1 Tax=Bacillus sp. AFS029533 TaxID=2033494 RepID=UPI0011567815|nr:three component ABC system middle component [Bacillus sp. AFS029533]
MNNYENTRNLYNNELIGAIAIASVLKYLNNASFSKCALILPIVTHKQSLNFLKQKNSVIRSMEEFVMKKPACFVNFDDRYISLLIISLNAITLLREIGVIGIKDEIIYYIYDNKFQFSNKDLGKRTEDIIKSAEKLATILDEDIANLYLQLRVKL